MSPLPAREELVKRLVRRYEENGLRLTTAGARKAAEVSVDACLPQLHPRSCTGKSIQEMMWDELMSVVERLYGAGEAADGRDPGRAEGIAICLAIIQNPYQPNIEAIRRESVERYEQEYADLPT